MGEILAFERRIEVRNINLTDYHAKYFAYEITALALEDKLAAQKQINALEAQRNQKRGSLFDAQDHIDSRRSKVS